MISLDEARASAAFARATAATLDSYGAPDVLRELRHAFDCWNARRDAAAQRCACITSAMMTILAFHPLPQQALLAFADDLEQQALAGTEPRGRA